MTKLSEHDQALVDRARNIKGWSHQETEEVIEALITALHAAAERKATIYAELVAAVDRENSMRDKLAALRAALIRIRDFGKLPLTDLNDTDEERASQYLAQLGVHASIARAALIAGNVEVGK